MADPFEALPTEIKQTIFVLAQKKLLSSTLLVSKSWYAQTIPLIWREVTLRSIWCIRTSQNAHLYLSLIHSLVFGLKDNRDYHDDIIQVFKKPHLPNLEKISYVPGVLFANDSIDYIISYLQPTLLSFYSIGGGLSLKLLSAVKETCTRLEDLRIKLPSDNITNEMSKDDFHNWLQIPSLRALSVFSKGSIDAPLVDDIMDQLLSKSTLQELLKRPFRRLCLEYRVDNLDELYTDSIRHTLRELSIVVRPSVIPGLRDLGRLQKLQLRVDGGSEGVISSLCSLVDLKSLKIIFTKATILQVDHVMELKHLAKLEELEIRTGPGEIFRGRVGPPPPIKILPFFDEEYFDQLASSLPKLRHVCLLFDWEPKSCHILKSAAFLWPEIEFLCLGNNIDIHESSLPSMTGKHMFPYLRKLKTRFLFTDVTGQYDYDQPDDDGLALNRYANKIVKNLSDAFPVLEGIKFCSSSDPDLRNAITNCVRDTWFPPDKQWAWNCYRLDWSWEFEEYF